MIIKLGVSFKCAITANKNRRKLNCPSNQKLFTYYCEDQSQVWWETFLDYLLGINSFNFHLRSFGRVIGTLPFIPYHTSPSIGVWAMIIEAVQKGVVTIIEPPASLPSCDTIRRATIVIVLIFGGERHTIMISERIPSSYYKRKNYLKIFQPDDTL